MPRHVLHPLPRAFAGHRDPTARRQAMMGDETWEKMDRVQVLGNTMEGHRGCVNALSWSDDGSTLLSGSDDKRICIWTADPSSSSQTSPHPLKMMDTIVTGHRANIFSARFLPNTNTPTIVSCAGDRDVRVFEVERLARAETGIGGRGREELWGADGPGVRVLKCHSDRTKRIATENSPYLFLTVSEDGTVRQHDLRRPHRCRSECPEALFYAPKGVDLYSLSVSTVTPHIFAVAGRTDCAFVCDRRMPERQTPSWGPHSKSSGQVNCVRRLGLPDEEWESVSPRSQRRVFSGERHITCVKMSPDKADEVICAFARHSTSLFSLFDSPVATSAKVKSPSPDANALPKSLPGPSGSEPDPTRGPEQFLVDPEDAPGIAKRTPDAHELMRLRRERQHMNQIAALERLGTGVQPASAGEMADEGANLGKRRLSELSTAEAGPEPLTRQRTTEHDAAESGSMAQEEGSAAGPSRIGPPSPPGRAMVEDLLAQLPSPQQEDITMGAGEILVPPLDSEDAEMEMTELRRTLEGESSPGRRRIGGDVEPIVIYDDAPASGIPRIDEDDDQRELRAEGETAPRRHLPARRFPTGPTFDPEDPEVQQRAFEALMELEDEEDGGLGGMDDDDDDMEADGDDDDDDEEDEDELDEDEFGDPLEMEEDAFDEVDPRSAQSEFGGVEMLVPRRSFRGARNVETVKDCNFLGVRSDKVCSGSDDGNFFVWDKDTGRLEGIYEGDGSVVNVMEQHPTLPIVAVSGIDNTVKLFAPTAEPPDPSFRRTHLAETIIKANTERPTFHTGSAFGRVSLLQFLASRGLVARLEEGEEGEGDTLQQCATQ